MKMKKSTLAILAIVVIASVMAVTAAATAAILGRVTLFEGHIKTMGAVAENQKIAFIKDGEDEFAGDDVDLTRGEEDEFPVIGKVAFDPETGDWISGSYAIDAPVCRFKVVAVNGNAENIRCRLDVDGGYQLAETVRVGITAEYPSGETKTAILNGFESQSMSEIDISTDEYSFNLGTISGEPIRLTARVWIDNEALSAAGIYGNSNMRVSLVMY